MFDWKMVACAAFVVAMTGSASIATAADPGEAEDNGPVAEASDGYQGKCVATKTAYRTMETQRSTSESDYVVMPKAGTTITQGGSKKGCVIVELTGYAYAPNGSVMWVKATVGGVECSPGRVQFVVESGTYSDAHSMKWVCPKVAPGKHKVKIWWKRGSADTKVYMTRNTTTVYYQ